MIIWSHLRGESTVCASLGHGGKTNSSRIQTEEGGRGKGLPDNRTPSISTEVGSKNDLFPWHYRLDYRLPLALSELRMLIGGRFLCWGESPLSLSFPLSLSLFLFLSLSFSFVKGSTSCPVMTGILCCNIVSFGGGSVSTGSAGIASSTLSLPHCLLSLAHLLLLLSESSQFPRSEAAG